MHRSMRPPARGLLAACLLASTAPALAAMGNTASTFGLFPGDVASAQALSMFNPQAAALYYNPSYLIRDPRGELTVGVLHAEQQLRGESQGGAAPPIRENDILDDSRSQQQLIALKTDLSSITRFDHPLYFAFIAGLEKYGKEMLAFNSTTSMEGQYFQYGRQPLFLNLGGGTEFLHGISVGASVHISLRSEAELIASSNLAGDTQYERLEVSAKPVLRPVLSTTQEWGKIVCGHNDDCFIGGLETAFTFRGHTEARTSVVSNITIPGTVPDPGILLLVDTLDSYQPDIYAAGVLYHFTDNFRVGITVERQNWSDLESKLRKDTVKDQADVRLKDITVPRVGFEWAVRDNVILTAGAAYQESPLESIRTKDVNYLDSDKFIVGVGTSLLIQNPPILAYPVRLDFGYQFQKLEDRDFELTSDRAPANPYETLTAGGEVHVFSGSLTLKF
ncbi:outer membrane protein transport protein [Alloalcanivorax mobilis]|uniref:outer membrane protein transport protein n=1 Tax=Alloalcanivorax mobilis TaxID=2019569 RepID=UPI001E34898A|nr:outer membrane protein transport protein [Alloalcanivorax mobilis]